MKLRPRSFPALAALLVAAGCATPQGPPDELLARGRELLAAGDPAAAEPYLKAVRSRHPDSKEAEEALYLEGEAERLQENGQTAFTRLQRFVETYPASPFSVAAAESLHALGKAYLDGDMPGFLFLSADRGAGVPILEFMQLHFPNHSLADDALAAVADYQMENERYEDAADTWQRLLRQYPRGEYALRARFQLAMAYWLRNEGARYDAELLHRAERGFKDFIGTVQYYPEGPEKYAEHVADAEQMVSRIRDRLAEKQVLLGRFYERTGHPRSAVVYYEHCLREYPDTRWAEEAKELLEELRREAG